MGTQRCHNQAPSFCALLQEMQKYCDSVSLKAVVLSDTEGQGAGTQTFISIPSLELTYATLLFFLASLSAWLWADEDSWYLERLIQHINSNRDTTDLNHVLYRMYPQSLCYASPFGDISPSISDSW